MKRVAIVVESARGCGRKLITGVAKYNNNRKQGEKPWSIHFEPLGARDLPPPWLAKWDGDGLLVQVRNKRIANVVSKLNVPMVDLRGGIIPISGVPSVGVDFSRVAKMAFEHLYERGFRSFGYCGLARDEPARLQRKQGAFIKEVRKHGFRCNVLKLKHGESSDRFERIKQQIMEWATKLERPAGVMVSDHPLNIYFLEACQEFGIVVPDEIATLSSGNDDFVCGLTVPSQTSVDVGSDRIGFEAAKMLDRLMRGRPVRKKPLLMPPRDVIVRGSTDILAISDHEVVTALRYIREHACSAKGITVADVLEKVALSRSALEPRLKEMVGRTIHQEICYVQLKQIKRLLVETDWPIKQIASSTGFQTTQYFTRFFNKSVGTTPAKFRCGHRQ